jgi:hypothetical protein
VARTGRVFARGNQAVRWVLKSTGEVNVRPGMNEVCKNWFALSTMPLDSGSLAAVW